MPLTATSVHDLRRIADAVSQLRDRTVTEAHLRSDCRQLRLTLEDGKRLLISISHDDPGAGRLEVDIIHTPDDRPRPQIEVRFDGR